ncbi:hypothetical protein NEOLEDRAFT_1157681 [Neolentinus lepideus HHB14362 ss-1]|uniref:DUF6570 domain-containing protein n=1 Tax=Neolentinus lepideus HHB14362 ss-1 TaxID=1314782 RepID=A0A165QK86_9AGAM|nr:hypothetical protein NEOLEDRAFT_1157681 [Neolentinus lepideus HHB14362 ss-1]
MCLVCNSKLWTIARKDLSNLDRDNEDVKFPPDPPSQELLQKIIHGFCESQNPAIIEETGCAVCGILYPMVQLIPLADHKDKLHLLSDDGRIVTRKERKKSSDLITIIPGLIIHPELDKVCSTFSSGMHKMRANAIMFANPTPKIYDVLPPPKSELDEVLAFIYTGAAQPTDEELKRTPSLDYFDINISYDNLKSYKDNMPPVVISYHPQVKGNDTLGKSLHDDGEDEGTNSGPCPLVAIAIKHLTSGGKIMAVGHAEHPESIYNNPHLYPQMFPWLFPYGFGGIGHSNYYQKISEIAHKQHLLMYHDKHFQ